MGIYQNQGYHGVKTNFPLSTLSCRKLKKKAKKKSYLTRYDYYMMQIRDYYLYFIGKKTEVQKNETTCSKRPSRYVQTGTLSFLKPNQQNASSSLNAASINQKGFEVLFGKSNNHGNNLMDREGKTPESLIFGILELRT